MDLDDLLLIYIFQGYVIYCEKLRKDQDRSESKCHLAVYKSEMKDLKNEVKGHHHKNAIHDKLELFRTPSFRDSMSDFCAQKDHRISGN